MCGVIGYYSPDPQEDDKGRLACLIKQSKIRGLHSFGVAWDQDDIWCRKQTRFQDTIDLLLGFRTLPKTMMFHNRYSTSGDWQDPKNNQPVTLDGMALVYNGVLDMGTKEEMEARFGFKMESYNDGELFLNAIKKGEEPNAFIRSTHGSFAGLWFDKERRMWALRNIKRPLWWAKYKGAIYIASTVDIFRRAWGNEFAVYLFEVDTALEVKTLL